MDKQIALHKVIWSVTYNEQKIILKKKVQILLPLNILQRNVWRKKYFFGGKFHTAVSVKKRRTKDKIDFPKDEAGTSNVSTNSFEKREWHEGFVALQTLQTKRLKRIPSQ